MTSLETAATVAEAQIEKSASKVTEKQRKKVEASIGVAFTAAVRSRNIDNLRGVFGRLKDEAYGAVGGKKKVLEALAGRVKEVKDEVQTSEFEGSELQDALERLGIEIDVQRDMCTDCQFYEFTGEFSVKKASLESDCARADFNAMTIVSVPHPKTGAMSCFKSDELSAYVIKFDGPVPYPRGFASGDMPPDIVDHVAQWQTALEDLRDAIKDGTLSHDEVQFFYRFADKLAPTSVIDAKSTYAAWAWRRLERAAPFLKGVKKGAKMAYSWLHILNGNRHWLMFVRAVICGVIIAKFVSGLAVSGALTGTAKAAIILKWVAVHSIGSMLTALFAQLRTIAGGTLTIILNLLFRNSAAGIILAGIQSTNFNFKNHEQFKGESKQKLGAFGEFVIRILGKVVTFVSSGAGDMVDAAGKAVGAAADISTMHNLAEKFWSILKRAPEFPLPWKAVPDIGSISAWVLYMRPTIFCRILSGLFAMFTGVASFILPNAGIKLLKRGTSRTVEGCDKLMQVWSYIMPMTTLVPMVTEILSDLLFAFNLTGHTTFFGPTSCQRLVAVGVPPEGVEYSGHDIADDVLFKALENGEETLTEEDFKNNKEGIDALLNFVERSQKLRRKDIASGDQEGAHYEENRTLGQHARFYDEDIEVAALRTYIRLRREQAAARGSNISPEDVLEEIISSKKEIVLPDDVILLTLSPSEKESLAQLFNITKSESVGSVDKKFDKDIWNKLKHVKGSQRYFLIELAKAETTEERNDIIAETVNRLVEQHLKKETYYFGGSAFSRDAQNAFTKVNDKVHAELLRRAKLVQDVDENKTTRQLGNLIRNFKFSDTRLSRKKIFQNVKAAQNELAEAIKDPSQSMKVLNTLRSKLDKQENELFERAKLVSEDDAVRNKNDLAALTRLIDGYKANQEDVSRVSIVKKVPFLKSLFNVRQEFETALKDANVSLRNLKKLKQNVDKTFLQIGNLKIDSPDKFLIWRKKSRDVIGQLQKWFGWYETDAHRDYVADLENLLDFENVPNVKEFEKAANAMEPSTYFDEDWQYLSKDLRKTLETAFTSIFGDRGNKRSKRSSFVNAIMKK